MERRGLVSDLHEVFGDALFEEHDVTTTDLRETASNPQTVSRGDRQAVPRVPRRARVHAGLASRVSDGGDLLGIDPARLPSEEVSDVLAENQNYFPELEEAAETAGPGGGLERPDPYPGPRCDTSRNATESQSRSPRSRATSRRCGWYDPARKRLHVSEILPPHARNFQLAHQLGLLHFTEDFERVIAKSRLTTPDSVALCRVALANYFASALLMPYGPFLESARRLRYDIELLEHRFGASFEQVCHRLTTCAARARRACPSTSSASTSPGNISKRFSGVGHPLRAFLGPLPALERAQRRS